MKLSEETKEKIMMLQKQYPERRSALIPALHIAQKEIGFLPHEIQKEVAALFDIAPSEVHSIVSFYDMFSDKPVGKNHIHVCTSISCMLRGGDELLSKVCEKLCVQPGETSPDGEFTVISSECLAACDKAPMVLINECVVGPVNKSDIDSLLQEVKKQKAHGEVDHA